MPEKEGEIKIKKDIEMGEENLKIEIGIEVIPVINTDQDLLKEILETGLEIKGIIEIDLEIETTGIGLGIEGIETDLDLEEKIKKTKKKKIKKKIKNHQIKIAIRCIEENLFKKKIKLRKKRIKILI
mmetsp:Transcript_10376/g.1635  ORF Transcript_10376/g.1635 Transcript_10376/m.1635 type:complete len:127 (+) Transcript_10376:1330-1710(+)